jgi:hypothetical protein
MAVGSFLFLKEQTKDSIIIHPQRGSTGVKYPLLRACSASAALMAAGKHTLVRTHRTSSDPAYLHTYVYCAYMKREEDSFLFPESGPKKNSRFSGNGPTKNRDPGIRV